MTTSLAGKVALVTGASKGLGAEIARQMAAAGAAVVVNYSSDEQGVNKVVAAITAKGGRAVAIRADVGNPAEVEKLFTQADEAFGGRLDILVNNAGIFFFAPLAEVTPDIFHQTFDVNVLGTILASKEAARRFGTKGGNIINISSVVAAKGFAGSSVYSATKGAIDSVTRVLATELAPNNVRVNAINPGLIITEGTVAAGMTGNEWEKQWESMAALGRAAKPADIAPIAVFLASKESGWLTGETIYATGGVR